MKLKTLKLSNSFLINITKKERNNLLKLQNKYNFIISTCPTWDFQLIQGENTRIVSLYLKLIKFRISFRKKIGKKLI